ncbi:MAG: tetratricopeptide repeat protein [Verrucomicrobia bacterium]|nr:tetratricopeptide repeat protein [Verrucomicrobiota bacterium]
MAWLAVSGLLLVGETTVGGEQGAPSSEARSATSQPPPSAGGEQPSPDPPASPGMGMPQPEAEAAALKREAVAVATQVAEAYPEDALAYALLGSAAYNTGRAEEAARYLKRCLELNPNQVDAYGVLARVAYDRGDVAETVSLLPGSPPAWSAQLRRPEPAGPRAHGSGANGGSD